MDGSRAPVSGAALRAEVGPAERTSSSATTLIRLPRQQRTREPQAAETAAIFVCLQNSVGSAKIPQACLTCAKPGFTRPCSRCRHLPPVDHSEAHVCLCHLVVVGQGQPQCPHSSRHIPAPVRRLRPRGTRDGVRGVEGGMRGWRKENEDERRYSAGGKNIAGGVGMEAPVL
jgi:hypothetical protein